MYRNIDRLYGNSASDISPFNLLHGFWTWDLETARIHHDEHCCRILGLPREDGEMAQEAWLRCMHARDLLRVMPMVEAAISGGEAYRIEYSVLNSSDQWVWLETHGRVVEWREGRPIRVAGIHTDITARIEAEQALAISQARQRALIAALPDLVFMIDSDGYISEYHPPAKSGIAYMPAAECIGRSYFTVFPDDIAHFITDSLLLLIEDPQPLSADMSMEIAGEQRELQMTLSLLRDCNNGPAGFLCVARDITERKRIEQWLIRGKERLALVLKGSGDAAWDWDLVNGEYWFSPRWWNMLGYPAEETSRDPELWCRFMPVEDAKRARRRLMQALADTGKDRFSVEFNLRHKAGHELRILARGHIQRDGKGTPLRVAGTNMDITRHIERTPVNRTQEFEPPSFRNNGEIARQIHLSQIRADHA